ncbi:MAG TPA: class I SAM-dependent methyltransferase [Ktedonobacter sp.]|nr:class I SAM-dependent methyltransferase [Ktedonobacter sp.]
MIVPNIVTRFQQHIGRQYSQPKGMIGRAIGERMRRQHEPEVQWTLSLLDVRPTDSILEIGFGSGRAIELLTTQAMNGHIAGIDLSHTMLQVASQRNAQAIQRGQVELREGNVITLPFGDAQFDAIFSIHTLYFWPDYSRAIAEIARVLKPNGLLVLTFSPGTITADGTQELNAFQKTVEEQVLPDMRRCDFSAAYLKYGPNSRQFLTTAVIGKK